MIRTLALVLALCAVHDAAADDRRARTNYMIHCQGCHLPEAIGNPGTVPRMNNFVGYFLRSQQGREFIVRVPGVSTSSLPDALLTELMNWLLLTYSAPQLPKDFVPFTVEEIAALRPDPEPDPATKRKEILNRIAADDPAVAQELDH